MLSAALRAGNTTLNQRDTGPASQEVLRLERGVNIYQTVVQMINFNPDQYSKRVEQVTMRIYNWVWKISLRKLYLN